MTHTTLHIGKHLLVCLLGSLSPSVLNPSKKLVLIEIEFLAFLVGWKQPFAYQCIYGRLGFSDDTASIFYFYQHMFVRWLWLEFRYHLFQFDDLFSQITYRFGQLIKCYCFFLHTPIVFNCSTAKETGVSMVESFTKI